ncbi:unnamed protein product, partial [Didymodactylos carnosus]
MRLKHKSKFEEWQKTWKKEDKSQRTIKSILNENVAVQYSDNDPRQKELNAAIIEKLIVELGLPLSTVRATINSILIEKKKYELILSTKERQIVDEFISLFELFDEATIKTQSENKPTISVVAPSVLEILADLEKEKCKYLETLQTSLLNSLKSRFVGLLSYFNIELPAQQRSMSKSFADPIFFISPVLDARFTFRWLDNVGLSPETIKCVTEKIKKMILNYTSQILGERIVTEARTQESAETVSNDSSCKKRKSLFSYLINAPKKVTTTNTAILAQLEEFLAEEGIDSNLIFQKQNKYPILLKLAKLFLS